GLERDGKMMGIAGKGKKSILGIERGGWIVDCLHLNRSKGNLAGDAEAAVEGVQEQMPAQPFVALGLGDSQPRQEKTRHRMLRQPLEQLGRGVGKLKMTRGQRVVAQDTRLSTLDGNVGRAELAPRVLAGVLLQEVVQRRVTAGEIRTIVTLAERFHDPVSHAAAPWRPF